MSKQQHPNQQLIQFILRAQQIALKDDRPDRGYAMMIVSIVSILMFSMLAACLTITNLSKLSTDASIDGNNSFYVAESGLNQRADQLRQKFIGYDLPTGLSPGQTTRTDPVTLANISNCFSAPVTTATSVVTSDFECRNYVFRYNNNAAEVRDSSGNIVLGEQDNNRNSSNYIAHTFVADRTNYKDPSDPTLGPQLKKIESGQPYAGIDAFEYVYTVYATAKKPNLVESNAFASFTPEEIAAKNRSPKIAGDDDLIKSYDTKAATAAATNAGRAANNSSINTVLQLDFKIRAIPLFQFAAFSNGDLDITSGTNMDFYGRIHANKNLLIRANNSGTTQTFDGNITTAGQLYTADPSKNASSSGKNYVVMSGGSFTLPDGRLAKELPAEHLGAFTATELQAFAPKIMNGALGVKALTTPALGYLRTSDASDNVGEYYGKADIRLVMQFDRAIPFDLSTIQTGTNAKGETCGTAWNIPSNRNNLSTAKCHQFTTGQLRSLQQPVLVLTSIANQTEETNRFCPALVSPAAAIQALAVSDRERVLRALQTAIVADPGIISVEQVKGSGNLTATQQGVFKTMLDKLMISGLNSTNISQLTPASIASARSSCFLPAPIQKLVKKDGSSGFFNRQEGRAMKMLQTNIESLTIWNRDGRYVDFTGTPMAYGTATNLDDAMKDATAADYATDGLLFERTQTADTDMPVGSFQHLGLAAKDRTEGGLVFHATIDDTTYPIDSTDNNRIYNSTAADKGKHQSPFGFAFNGGKNLPAPLTLATDQGIYLQGDYNNFARTESLGVVTAAGAKQPAAVMGDTITVLSNQCLSAGSGIDYNQLPAGQINCGINPNTTFNTSGQKVYQYRVTAKTEVYAAFATNQESSCGDPSQTASAAYCSDRRTRFQLMTTKTVAQQNPSGKDVYFGGGVQNFARMLENWGGSAQTFFYRGSMIKLDTPQEYNGPYTNVSSVADGNSDPATNYFYYNFPARDFGYDTDFNSFSKLPPLTPRVLSLGQEVFKRQR